MEVYEGKLWVALFVAGMGQGNNLPPSVDFFDGSQWQLSIASDAWPEDYQGIYELFADSDDYLYLGLGGTGQIPRETFGAIAAAHWNRLVVMASVKVG